MTVRNENAEEARVVPVEIIWFLHDEDLLDKLPRTVEEYKADWQPERGSISDESVERGEN